MLPIFRGIAILEGISYLLLFALSMPLKYWAGIAEPNIYIGYAHGVLFIGYLLLAAWVWWQRKWGFGRLAYLVIASLLPFGTFYVERRWLRDLSPESSG
ncbi:DUF3817 domain-containing protein [Robiginitalea sp. M366]|uniref:DUF3817 domain-containing protein n=1 Tax=Robiginitalea aestuariiviva TaxID=3036903 RepID=UPI00240D8402|nr:DUF3817 domain-containing protein [Robiginitalea aestuariiviva]MDG1572583.1 DUF3817 domain-containing protein [Robiginitalea aestuariiviva]